MTLSFIQRGDSIEEEDSSRDEEDEVVGELGTRFETVELNDISDKDRETNTDAIETEDSSKEHETKKFLLKHQFKCKKKKQGGKAKIVSLVFWRENSKYRKYLANTLKADNLGAKIQIIDEWNYVKCHSVASQTRS